MKKKKIFVIWVIIFILSIAFLIYMTCEFYRTKQALYAYMMNVFTMIDIIIAIVGIRKQFVFPYINNHRYDYDLKSFVDRDSELKNVIEKINTGNKIVYISGRTGIGKTQFLHKLIETLHETPQILNYPSIYPLYIDLKKGDDIKSAIKAAIQVQDDLNNIDLLKEMHRLTQAKTILILLDNTDKHLYLEMEEFINTLVSIDEYVIFIVSTESSNPLYQSVKMGDFTENEVNEIAAIEELDINRNECDTIIKNSGGLPSIIQLLIKQLKKTGDMSGTREIESYIEKICHKLSTKQQDLLITIAYYSLVGNRFSSYLLGKYNSNCTKHNLIELSDNGLIDYNTKTGLIIIQDYFSEIIRTIYEDNRFEICNALYFMIDKREEKNELKLIFLLLSDFEIISQEKLVTYLSDLLLQRKYQFLLYLFELLDDFHKLNKCYDSKDVRMKLLYCYIHSLLELGEYVKARDYINCSKAWNNDINLKHIDSTLEFNINFDLADMDHFFGNFELAIDSYIKLKNYDISEEDLLKCNWAIGHCYRHLGDLYSLNIALSCFKNIIDKKKQLNNSYYIRAYQSLILTKLYLNDTEYNYHEAFSEMIKFLEMRDKKRINEILTSRQYAIFHRIILHDNATALDILFAALEELEITGVRIKYDYYFEIGETLRHKFVEQRNESDIFDSLMYYNKALEFADRSRDISLKRISQIGIVLCHIITNDISPDDLNIILEICDFCSNKKIAYIFNYAYQIKEYLLNDIYLQSQDMDSVQCELMNMNLFIF